MGKIVVVGSTGFCGSALIRRFAEKDIEGVKAIASSSRGPSLHKDAEWIIPHLEGADTVYICAGQTGGVGKMSRDPMSFVYPNIGIHMNMFQICSDLNVRRVVCLQSTTGYRDSDLPMQEHEYLTGELHPSYFVPGNVHRFIYRLSQMFRSLEVVFFRPSNVYGPGNDFNPQTSHVIEATIRKVLEKQDPFTIWGTGLDVRDAAYIDDLAEAMTRAIDCPPGAYNIAAGQEMNVNEIVKILCEYADFRPTISHDLHKPTAIPARRVDIERARSLLGWEPQVMMRDGLKRTYEWAKAQMAAGLL